MLRGRDLSPLEHIKFYPVTVHGIVFSICEQFCFRLPSVSAAVASYAPEVYIWRIFIAIHGGPRLALAFAYRLVLRDEMCNRALE